MATALVLLLISGIGICLLANASPLGANHIDSFLDDKEVIEGILPLKYRLGEDNRRYKRVILPRHDAPPLSMLTHPHENSATELPTSVRPQRNKAPKGNRNKKKNGGSKDDGRKSQKNLNGSDKKSKKQGKSKKMNPEHLREGQSPRRLRQHMQHKKKVKQFLQKRIQQQIEQRNPNYSKP